MRNEEEKIIAHREADKRYREKRRKENPFKICSCCGKVRPFEEFIFSNTEKRCKSKCKKCRHDIYIANKEKALKNATEYYRNNKEYVLKRMHDNRKLDIAKAILKSAKKRAKKKGLEFNIDESDFIVPERCPILDIPLIQADGVVQRNSYSIDRIDSNKGYIKGNVIIISYLANTIKTNATVEEIRKVAEFYEKLQSK